MATTRVRAKNGWTLVRQPAAGGKGRRGAAVDAASGSDIPPEFLQADGISKETYEAVAPPAAAGAQRRAAPPDLEIEVGLAPGEASILAIRHPSGALTFHPSTERVARLTRRDTSRASSTTTSTALFRVPVRRLEAETGRRGIFTKALKVIVLKVAKAAVDKAVSVALPILAARWEKSTWAKKGLSEGWFHVAPAGNHELTLTAGTPPAEQRSLLLLHGTFSNANGAYGSLAGTDFFQRARTLYDDRIYAFNHFSVSRTPDENARMLLDGLPAGEHLCDAITHSRGGLVLRNLVEHSAAHGAAADRFRLGHAVLVASPNDGTPLATPARWEETVGWFANLMELFPDNPFTIGAEFVSESLVWLASHLAGDLPGLRSMDGAGPMVKELQSPPGPPANAYSALVSNFHPDAALWQRALDVGADQFFGSANDLVVPSEGGWRIDRDGTPHIPSARIGCYGPGGNLGAAGTAPVHHLNFFGRAETADFLVAALSNEKQKLTPVDPDVPLPDRRFTRGGGGAGPVAAAPRVAAAAAVSSSRPALPVTIPVASPPDDSGAFHLLLMPAYTDLETEPPPTFPEWAHVLASYGGARVMSKFRLRRKDKNDKNEKPTAFGEIIRVHERIKTFTDDMRGTLPSDEEMIEFGGLLFDTLFQGDVRRLYDEARARQHGRKLDFVLTSQIAWIAEKPWEFCYDRARKSFLATEEIHFVRNVVTAVPADPITPCRGPLRILIASAQPVNFGGLSIEQETESIRSDFQPLEDAGLATIEILQRATPEAIHRRLETGGFDIVHFIGHGEFDKKKKEGVLVFEDDRGGAFRLGERSVRQIFCGRGLSLVFLNSCQSARGGRSDFNKGVAQSLVAHGLPALVANQYSVLDASASSFARYFYWSLAQGYSLGHSAREARIAVNYSLQGDLIDWAVPVLYARDANQTLCTTPAAEAEIPMTASTARVRRRPADKRLRRVAVWDIEKVFPSLEKTLDRMNAAQDVFGFELVEMSAPLDAWDRSEGSPSLLAERLAMRLGGKPMELQVDVLACITRHPLKDKDGQTLYGWWPAPADPPVGIFSTAGLELAPEGTETDRAIANTAVAFLARFFAKRDTHTKGPKNCPFFRNDARDVQVLTQEQKFDAACRKELRKSMATELPALDALLKAF
jgi:hypothetical protein